MTRTGVANGLPDSRELPQSLFFGLFNMKVNRMRPKNKKMNAIRSLECATGRSRRAVDNSLYCSELGRLPTIDFYMLDLYGFLFLGDDVECLKFFCIFLMIVFSGLLTGIARGLLTF